MVGELIVNGMVISSSPIGETDKRVVLLTKEEGKISAFARGARRMNSPLIAATMPFTYGVFSIYRGRDSAGIKSADIRGHFSEITDDIDALWYGSYFLEVAEYFALEGADETDRLNLLYVTLHALSKKQLSPQLIRWVYELRSWAVNGEYPNVFSCVSCGREDELTFFSMSGGGSLCADCGSLSTESEKISQSAHFAMQYIITAPFKKLYSFNLKKEVEDELISFLKRWRNRYFTHKYKSEEFLTYAKMEEI
ncbi:MAG: DNA repair protein RecO [Lachnospiraceae bacterium]|nr:DNA repair protein RecO [Lachnospiraceae bacterium]